MPAEPESRDEQKVKDFMIQKYERKRWYTPPQQVEANTSNSTPDPKPLKHLLGENSTNIVINPPQVVLQLEWSDWNIFSLSWSLFSFLITGRIYSSIQHIRAPSSYGSYTVVTQELITGSWFDPCRVLLGYIVTESLKG